MVCPDCQGSGVNIIDESHTDICDMCDGYGYIAITEDGKTEDRDDKQLPEVRQSNP